MSVEIIYIAGETRSGSTILDRVLGAIPGAVSGNEIFPDQLRTSLLKSDLCACGEVVSQCPFWSDVMAKFGEWDAELARLGKLQLQVDRMKNWIALWFGWQTAPFRAALREYQHRLGSLYRHIADVSGASVIIDSTKTPSRALILSSIPGFKVHVVHLVRDPRAVTYAWRKRKIYPASGQEMNRHSPWFTAVHWTITNLLAELLGFRLSYQRIRYEDFASAPQTSLLQLMKGLNLSLNAGAAFLNEHTVELGVTHSVAGNPVRFDGGTVSIRPDSGWRRFMAVIDYWVTTVLTVPLLVRYRYIGMKG